MFIDSSNIAAGGILYANTKSTGNEQRDDREKVTPPKYHFTLREKRGLIRRAGGGDSITKRRREMFAQR